MSESDFAAKTAINKRVQARYDELMHEGKHGHYETMFRVVHEEIATLKRERDAAVEIIKDCWGALNFILAFYEPGQRYLDTNAWKNAEASGRRAHAKARKWIDALAPTPKEGA
jgi:hypothetical protein